MTELNNEKKELLSLLPDELVELMAEIGEPKYRASQIFSQLHKGLCPDEMTNIGNKTREKLMGVARYHLPKKAGIGYRRHNKVSFLTF